MSFENAPSNKNKGSEPIELETIGVTHPLNSAEPPAPSRDRSITFFMAEGSWKIILGVVVAVIVVILGIVLAGIQTVEYHEYGLLKRRSTGKIYTDKVYHSTRVVYGPDYEMVTFPSTAQLVKLENIAAITLNNQQISIYLRFQYFIRKNELGKLFENHKFNYHHVIVKTAIDSIKDAATDYEVEEFINNRESISEALFNALRKKLEGICCMSGCHKIKQGCMPDCKNCTESSSSETERGLFIEVRYFQLGDVNLNYLFRQKKLKGLILTEDQERKKLEQQAKLVRQDTERRVREIKARTNEIKYKSLSDARLIEERADSLYTLTTETARSEGLKKLYNDVGLKDEKAKNSFDYLRTIQNSKHVSLAVGFQQYITGNLPKS